MKRARDIGSPALLLFVALAAIAAGVRCDAGTRSCKQGTLFLTVMFGGTTRDANQVSIDVIINSGPPTTSMRNRTAGAAQGTIEIDFPNGYPVDKPVDVRVTALRNGSALATKQGSVPALPAGCATLTVALDDGASAGAGGAGGGGTSGGGAGGTGTSGTGGGRGGTGGSGVVPTRDVDLLFLIDDSSSMRLAQASLERSFPAFMTQLRGGPQGLPNIHVAVVSQDMGAGNGTIAGCDSTGGKNGIFQYTARGSCAATNLQPGATYISDVGGQRNYTGNLEDVFTCIAALGESGCGFEHQFAAILRALGADGQLAPAENQGFLRPGATLGIIMITNEDDCSAVPGVQLYDTAANTNLASQFGPPANFRCNEFGHICDGGGSTGVHPNRNAPGNNMSAMVTYTNCRSNDTEGFLLSAVDTANRLKALKADPSQVLVAAITGPPTPYTVTWRAPSTSDTTCGATSCPWPALAHSCTAADTSFADPPVRIVDLLGQFGDNGLRFSICGDIGAALQSIADRIIALTTI